MIEKRAGRRRGAAAWIAALGLLGATVLAGCATGSEPERLTPERASNLSDEQLRDELYRVARDGNAGELALLIDHGVEVEGLRELARDEFLNFPDELESGAVDDWEVSPLMVAAANGNAAVAEQLIEHGASVSTQGSGDLRALHYAALSGNAETVARLLEAGAQVEAENNSGWRPLHYAAHSGDAAMVARLLEAGAEVEAEANNGARPLHSAALSDNAETVARLLEAGAEVDAEDSGGWRPLHLAAGFSDAAMVNRLLKAGADIEAETDSDDGGIEIRPLHAAASEGNLGVVKELLKRGANVTARTSEGETALALAEKEGHGETVQVLERAVAKAE